MDLMEAIRARHSVRQYIEKPLESEAAEALQREIYACNEESGLHIQLIKNEPKAFDSFMAHYGRFSGVTNYIALVGEKSDSLDEACGYYGERLVLAAQQLGLNTCWVALTYRKIPGVIRLNKGEKLALVIAVGYGKGQGKVHRSKRMKEVAAFDNATPDWFLRGVEAALLAPTAVNQQKFFFSLSGKAVTATAGRGICAKIDLGIVKYHFEIGAGKKNFHWS